MSICKDDDRDHTFEAKDAHRIQDEAHVGSLIQVKTRDIKHSNYREIERAQAIEQ
jgi:hypothetical protein